MVGLACPHVLQRLDVPTSVIGGFLLLGSAIVTVALVAGGVLRQRSA